MKKVAVIDVGSNSVKLFVGSLDNGSLVTVIDELNIARLSEGMTKSGLLSSDAIYRNVEAISIFLDKARMLGAEKVYCIGTMALRSAENSDEFRRRLFERTALELSILPGVEEARLSYLAAVSSIDKLDNLLVFDTGGGSTEFIYGKKEGIENRFSLDLGAVRLTENYLVSDPVKKEEICRARREIVRMLESSLPVSASCQVIGIGGTVTTMSAVKQKLEEYDSSLVQGSVLTHEDIKAQVDLYSSLKIEDRKKICGLQAKRADVILAGSLIVDEILSVLNVSSLTVSDRGLRHGLCNEKLVAINF
ncbi:MAG: Ppx/GppA family phosphatase [Sphaerochaetaceae bacterium]|nr:Ppx/GppA family phosphatase [Sphaerochaetaceae bacterium]